MPTFKSIGIISDARLPTSPGYPGHGLGKLAYNLAKQLYNDFRVVMFAAPQSYSVGWEIVECTSEEELAEKAKAANLDVYIDLSHEKQLDVPNKIDFSVDRESRPKRNPIMQTRAHAEYWGLPYSPIVPNFIDVTEYPLGEGERKYFLYLAPFHPKKGIKTALFAGYMSDEPLVVAGPGTDRLISGMGPVVGDQKIELLQGARALLFPSSHEAGPTTVLEAMACGTPVICYDYGGAAEMVGEYGICAKTQEEFNEAVIQFGSHDPMALRQYVEKNFSPQKAITILTDLLEQVYIGNSWRGWYEQ